MSTLGDNASYGCTAVQVKPNTRPQPGLKKIEPYWYPYRTNAKARWFDREILEVVSTEFRDRSVEYYRYALESGVTTINGKIARPGTLVRNGDTIENIVHRHEPPVTSTPVEILHHDVERDFVVINKPGSIPVHAAGRYFRNSLVEILKNDFGFPNVYTVNRLDRLTSGLMIIALSSDRARALTAEFTSGTIQKEYVARVRGNFPVEEITCEEPLLTVDRQMGLNIVHPAGKEAKTVFKRMHYDSTTDTTVVHCRPVTGRSHQIRVHLQFLGHPIANDAVYGDARIWGPRVGKGGIDTTPSEEREAPRPPPELEDSTAEGQGRFQRQRSVSSNALEPNGQRPESTDQNNESALRISNSRAGDTPSAAKRAAKREERRWNPAYRTKEESATLTSNHTGEAPAPGALPRETGHDIGLGSPVPLSREAVDIITRLRNQKDEDEDWGRWRDVIFRAKGALTPREVAVAYAYQNSPPSKSAQKKQKNQKGMKNEYERSPNEQHHSTQSTSIPEPPPSRNHPESKLSHPTVASDQPAQVSDSLVSRTQGTEEVLEKSVLSANGEGSTNVNSSSEYLYCPECYLPLHPDPKPERLYIFLHALRYTSASLGAFETRLPEWAEEGYTWE